MDGYTKNFSAIKRSKDIYVVFFSLFLLVLASVCEAEIHGIARVNNPSFELEIRPSVLQRFSVKAKSLDLSSISLDSQVNPVNFDLQFGGYSGKTEIQFDKKGRFRQAKDSAD